MEHEGAVRLGVFVLVLVCMGAAEWAKPARQRLYARRSRWFANLGLVGVDTVILRLVLPVLAVDMALVAQTRGWGLFHTLNIGSVAAIVASLVLLDLVVYWQHRIFHQVKPLWRLHQVHHTDRDFDVTTALRFHPVEIVLSMILKMAVVLLLGVPVLAVILFEVILNAMALFNHANFRLPGGMESLVRRAVVTPDMHRIHHSVRPEEFNSNYGFNLSVWDRIFGSYVAQPVEGHEGMTIGQAEWQADESRGLVFMLMLPFRRAKPGGGS